MVDTAAPGRAPNLPVTVAPAPQPSIGNDMHANPTLRTQTYTIKGQDKHGAWKEMRVTAPSKDYARYIAHQRGMSIAECEVKK